ncbi:MAG: cation:proton antiporter [Gemmatimonadota bacterium]
MATWTILQDVLILLLGAMLLGALFDRLKQDAVLGYLLAGALLGPHAFDVIPNRDVILGIAELGVALLLFAIGMDFSWRKLRRIGPVALGGGTLQVVITTAIGTAIGRALGLDMRQAVVVGAMVALSSTALVTRLLLDRAEMDSVHGRNAVGILLLQDIAVVPLVLIVTALGDDRPSGVIGLELVRAFLAGLALVGVIFVLLRFVFPRLVEFSAESTNHDLPVLLAVVVAIGCAAGAHALGLSPLLGAFVGGVMLSQSPFGTQVRADVTPLKALFVTLFFAAIGTLTNPQMIVEQWSAVGGLAASIVVGKSIVVFAVVLLFRSPVGAAAATALCLAQIGEFSFVLLEISRSAQLISLEFFELMVTVVVATLFVSPYLVALAARVARMKWRGYMPAHDAGEGDDRRSVQVVLVGFGPAGRTVAEQLKNQKISFALVEQHVARARKAEALDIDVIIGDATRKDVLRRAGVGSAKAVAITVPDPAVAQRITAQARSLARGAVIVARSRYQRHSEDLHDSGATFVSDEESLVGLEIASKLTGTLDAGIPKTKAL